MMATDYEKRAEFAERRAAHAQQRAEAAEQALRAVRSKLKQGESLEDIQAFLKTLPGERPDVARGKYWVHRTGEFIESVMVVASGVEEAKEIAKNIPDEAWAETRWEYLTMAKGNPVYRFNNVSLSDDRKAWNE